MARVHLIANQKGGVGKTTIAVNLAAVTADALGGTPEDSPVLVVSTDPQGSSVWWADRVGPALPFDFAQAHDTPRDLAKLRNMDRYQEVFVDTPGSLEQGHILRTVLDQADDIIVPMVTEPLCFAPTAHTVRSLIQPTGCPWQVVINAWDPRDGTADRDQTRDYVQAQGWPLAPVVIRRYKLHTRASADGRVVTQYPRSAAASEATKDFLRLRLALLLNHNAGVNPVTTPTDGGQR